VVEEAAEVCIAGVKGNKENLVNEVADLMYHSLVLLSASGARPEDVWKELRQRQK
jgi:phosphoribosyl-ATP pyrophosphohydrolase